MEQLLVWGITLAISVFFAWVLYRIAAKRGASKIFWATLGFLFGPFVFLARKVGGDEPVEISGGAANCENHRTFRKQRLPIPSA